MTVPYLVLAVLVLVVAFVLSKVSFPAQTLSQEQYPDETRGSVGSLVKSPHFVWAVVSQFCYVGAQVGTWSYLIQYVQEYTHQSEKIAGYFLSGTLLIFAVGRFAATYSDEVHRSEPADGVVCADQYRPADRGDWKARMDGPVRADADELLYVVDVSDQLCFGLEAAWAEHDAGRVGDCDGDHRWRGGDTNHRLCSREDEQHGYGFDGTSGWVLRGRVLRLHRLSGKTRKGSTLETYGTLYRFCRGCPQEIDLRG